MNHIKALMVAGVVFAIMESAWLLATSQQFYAKRFPFDLKIQSTLAVLLVYPLMLFAAWVFLLRPMHGFIKGALFGTVIYGTYNLTNKATIPKYPWDLVVVDTAWGATLFAVSAEVYKRCSLAS